MSQSYETCCAISLCSTEHIVLEAKDLLYITTDDISTIQFKRYSFGFIFDEKNDTIDFVQEKEENTELKEGSIYIENIVHTLSHIQRQETSDSICSISDNIEVKAIAKYFEVCINETCTETKMSLEKMCFAIVIPNEWISEMDIIHQLITLLFKKAAIISSQNQVDRISYVTQLEALLFDRQNSLISHKKTELFIQNENRCIFYNISLINNRYQQQSVYFQFKEKYDLKIYNGHRIYTPKILNTDETLQLDNVDFQSIEDMLTQLLINQILLLGDGAESNKLISLFKRDINLLDMIIACLKDHTVLDGFMDSSKNPARFSNFKSFVEKAIEALRVYLFPQIQKSANYIISQNEKVPFVQKSIILYNHNSDLKIPRLELQISSIFVHLLSKEIARRIQENEPLSSYMLLSETLDYTCLSGALHLMTIESICSNIMLPPVLIKKSTGNNKVGEPGLQAVEYIDISWDTVSVVREHIDEEGFIQKTITLKSQNLKEELASFASFLHFQYGVNNFDSKFQESEILLITNFTVPSKRGQFKTLFGDHCDRTRVIDTTLKTREMRSHFASYIIQLIDNIGSLYEDKCVKTRRVGYVLCVEKLFVMDRLLKLSRTDLLELIKENPSPRFLGRSPRKIIVADHGEKSVWDALQTSDSDLPSFCVHSHIQDDYIYLKMYQVVDISESTEPTTNYPRVFIKDKLVSFKDPYEQVTEYLWHHIDEFVDTASSTWSSSFRNFESFNKSLMHFIKNEDFGNQADISRKYTIEISDGIAVTISLLQIIHIAIIPALESVLSVIISSLNNTDIFGHYEIAKLFITGSFLKIKNFNNIYHHIVTTEANKICKNLIRETTYRTKMNINITTSRNTTSSQLSTNGSRQRLNSFCYNVFLRGELRIVSSSTYTALMRDWRNPQLNEVDLGCIMHRGNELLDKKIEIANTSKVPMYQVLLTKHFQPYHAQSAEVTRSNYNLGATSLKPAMIRMEYLHYCSCIRIIYECYYKDRKPSFKKELRCESSSHIFGERFTLKYFQ